ncbi:hypothetical protein [Caulobacter sp. SSI4214]|uniref:hypothetical protein n=1 Tax=Caulobacter sp. SSI4214 TaxID=2575739 RepID=UPI00143981E8|nr:hypothetical protein [Caulobacter sp. SSI4214]
MKDDRTCRSEQYWDEEVERLGGHARPFVISGADAKLLDAIDHAISAGACRVAARMNPQSAATWNAVAEAKRREAKKALAAYLKSVGRRGA